MPGADWLGREQLPGPSNHGHVERENRRRIRCACGAEEFRELSMNLGFSRVVDRRLMGFSLLRRDDTQCHRRPTIAGIEDVDFCLAERFLDRFEIQSLSAHVGCLLILSLER